MTPRWIAFALLPAICLTGPGVARADVDDLLVDKVRYPSTKWVFHLGKKLKEGQVINALQTDEDGNSSG